MGNLRLGVFVSDAEEAFSVVGVPHRARHPYLSKEGHFMVVSSEGVRWLRTLGLSGRARDLLDLACEHAEHGNLMSLSYSWAASQLGVHENEIYRQVRTLRGVGVLWKRPNDGRGHWRVSPRLLWKGNPRDLPEALAAYKRAVSGVSADVHQLRAPGARRHAGRAGVVAADSISPF